MARGWEVEYQETVIKRVYIPWADAKSAKAARLAVETEGADNFELISEDSESDIKITDVSRSEYED